MAFAQNAQHFGGYVMPRPRVGHISGVPMDQNTCDTWDDIWKFQAHPEDVLVAAYPKAGITWMQEVVDMICQEGDVEKCHRAPTYDKHPFLEAVAPKPVPSVFWGSWFDHVQGWWEAKNSHQVLYIFYEDMMENTRREIEKVMRFLGKELSEDVLEEVYQHTTFQAMRGNPMANYSTIPSFVMDHSISPFMRKGVVGDWRNHFTVAQDEVFEEEYGRRMEGTTLTFRTRL
ncbi:sulfotransferase 1C1-like isoform X2 [Phyllobates terribilis]|uniref:sulfotransferase 1C1-like isoform X2 n=1 Tax=Phyllobates terribilis TaxID=111132 RepID=UPI003CCB3043